MTRGIKEEFAYLRRSEKGVQSPGETLRLQQRQLPGLRGADDGSGAVARPRRPLRERLHRRCRRRTGHAIGGGSTHGWMQAYLPGAGWVDFDPTNSIVGNRNLIRVAVAWDQRNALPLWGTFIGPASAFLSMDVDVQRRRRERRGSIAASPPVHAVSLTHQTERPSFVPLPSGPAAFPERRRTSRKSRYQPGSSWSAGDRGTRADLPS